MKIGESSNNYESVKCRYEPRYEMCSRVQITILIQFVIIIFRN